VHTQNGGGALHGGGDAGLGNARRGHAQGLGALLVAAYGGAERLVRVGRCARSAEWCRRRSRQRKVRGGCSRGRTGPWHSARFYRARGGTWCAAHTEDDQPMARA
jgi:hypothetical protein